MKKEEASEQLPKKNIPSINNTTADATNTQIIVESINLAEAFRKKKKSLADKISNRADDKIKNGNDDGNGGNSKNIGNGDIEKKEPLESVLIRKKKKEKEDKLLRAKGNTNNTSIQTHLNGDPDKNKVIYNILIKRKKRSRMRPKVKKIKLNLMKLRKERRKLALH